MMVTHSLAFAYNQTGLRDVLRSFMDALQPQREHEVRELPDSQGQGVPKPWRELMLPMELALVLLLG